MNTVCCPISLKKYFLKNKNVCYRYDTQHVTMNKENHEYHEWKRKHDEDVQVKKIMSIYGHLYMKKSFTSFAPKASHQEPPYRLRVHEPDQEHREQR